MDRWPIAALVLGVGCGPGQPTPPAEHDELCAEAGPIPLLSFPVGEEVDMAAGGVSRVGERFYIHVEGPEASRVEAVGLCGESATPVGSGIDFVRERTQYPGLPLGCREDDDATVLVDPDGDETPRVVFSAGSCRGIWTTSHIFAVETVAPSVATVLVWDLPTNLDGPRVSPRTLLDEFNGYQNASIAAFDDEIFALDLDARLIRVAVADGTTTVEREGVARFEVSADRRFLGYLEAYDEVESGFIRGELIVRDRDTGAEAMMPEAYMGLGQDFAANGFVRVWLDWDPRPMARLLDLETFEIHEVPDELVAWSAVPDGRWLISDQSRQTWWLRDLATAEMIELDIRGTPNIADRWIYEQRWVDITDAYGLGGPLRRIRYDGSPATTLVDEVWRGFEFLGDGRILTHSDDERPRQFLVADPTTRQTQVLASEGWGPMVPGTALGLGPHDIVYGAREDTASAIFRTRLQPRQ